MSNRRWSAHEVSAEPAGGQKTTPALQELNITQFNSCRVGIWGVRYRRFRASRSTDGYSYYAPAALVL